MCIYRMSVIARIQVYRAAQRIEIVIYTGSYGYVVISPTVGNRYQKDGAGRLVGEMVHFGMVELAPESSPASYRLAYDSITLAISC